MYFININIRKSDRCDVFVEHRPPECGNSNRRQRRKCCAAVRLSVSTALGHWVSTAFTWQTQAFVSHISTLELGL